MPTRDALSAEQLVTSSDLVRHFGLWQERAARAPLYILHRGRPRFVRISVETMEALCDRHAAAARQRSADPTLPPDLTAVLDGVGDIVLLADADGAIRAVSRTARKHFGDLAAHGAPIEGITPTPTRGLFTDAIRRVTASAIGDRLEIPSAARPGRMLLLAIEPAGTGVALFGQDSTTQRDQNRVFAADQAREAALGALCGMASATINQRGYIIEPTPSLAALTGLVRESLATIRFVSLAERGDRVALGDAIEACITGGPSCAVDARLIVNRADPVAARIGLAPVRLAGGIDGVAAMIVARASA